MGQYYAAVIENEKIGCKSYYTYGMKLMEHSWWGNKHMMFVAKFIYKQPSKVVWVGDYANEKGDWKRGQKYYSIAHGKKSTSILNVYEDIKDEDCVSLDHRYLVNHDKKIFLNCDKYYKKNLRGGWCINPISLLTAKGNGRGCGDYYSDYPDYDLVGTWALDSISLEDEAPANYEEVMYNFVEEA